jgi:hypothetical protein
MEVVRSHANLGKAFEEDLLPGLVESIRDHDRSQP